MTKIERELTELYEQTADERDAAKREIERLGKETRTLLGMVAVHLRHPKLGGLSGAQTLAIKQWHEGQSELAGASQGSAAIATASDGATSVVTAVPAMLTEQQLISALHYLDIDSNCGTPALDLAREIFVAAGVAGSAVEPTPDLATQKA